MLDDHFLTRVWIFTKVISVLDATPPEILPTAVLITSSSSIQSISPDKIIPTISSSLTSMFAAIDVQIIETSSPRGEWGGKFRVADRAFSSPHFSLENIFSQE